MADLGAECSWWNWQPDKRSEWPEDATFRSFFEYGIETVKQPASCSELLDRLDPLAPSFDIILSDFSATEVGEGDLHARLKAGNPAIIAANVSHLGRGGPYATWTGDEVTDYALGGYWAIGGEPDRPPLRVPGYQAQFHGGMQLAIATLAALRHARDSGCGQAVETSSVEAMIAAHWSTTVAWTHEGRILRREGCDLLEAKDGWVFFYALGFFPNLFLLIDRPDLMDDPRWQDLKGRRDNAGELREIVGEWCKNQSADYIVETSQELRMPVTRMATAADLLADPVLAERQYFRAIAGDALPGLPYRWSSEWPEHGVPSRLASALRSPDTSAPPSVAGGRGSTSLAANSALEGTRILELTNNWAGPVAARHLADLGADVTKVELATRPATRGSHYPGTEPGKYHWNRSGYFNEMNRNKRGLSLDLSKSRGRELFLALVADSDVVIENNSARVMPNLGLGFDQLRRVNPRLVMASICGFGATGVRKDWVAYGSNIEAACGLAAMNGYDDGIPQRTGSFVADPIAGAHAAIGVLAALERRDRTGEGAHLDISLTESAMPFMLRGFTHLHETGQLHPRMGNAELWDSPVGAYRSAGTDDWVAIAVRTNGQWLSLSEAAGLDPELGRTRAGRIENRAQIDSLLGEWTSKLTHYECAQKLQSLGIPAAPILLNWEMHSDPHLFARDAFIPIEHPDTGILPYPGFPWMLSLTPPSVRRPAPRFGQDNAYVFRERLGLDEEAIYALYSEGITADAPIGLVPPTVINPNA